MLLFADENLSLDKEMQSAGICVKELLCAGICVIELPCTSRTNLIITYRMRYHKVH